ncbi:MAG: cysteine desulfurase [Candidatus Wildermuthbacteria bacterium]|nr:cysteine desulfurase [Candidatus Wildermuthbacteria bacterium]
MSKRIYFDYAASSPLDGEVLKAMLPYLKKEWGNPSSAHSFGQKARAALERAREKVAKFLSCQPLEVVFTSGATEANNLVIQGLLQSQNSPHVITSKIEHESVLSPIQELEVKGVVEATYIAPNKEGIIDPADVQKAIKANTILVSIMYANSEIGTIQPIAEIGAMIQKLKIENRKSKIVFHTDAVQAAQFLDCDVQKLGVDLLTLSGHKIYGPKGVGVLYIKERTSLSPLHVGGGQEQGMRSGTENVAGIVGMGEAVEEVQNPKASVRNIKIRQLRDLLIKEVLKKIPGSLLSGSPTLRLPNNAHFRFQGIHGKDLAILLDQKGFAVSTGSACSEKTEEPSHVLLALGLSVEESLSALRVIS